MKRVAAAALLGVAAVAVGVGVAIELSAVEWFLLPMFVLPMILFVAGVVAVVFARVQTGASP